LIFWIFTVKTQEQTCSVVSKKIIKKINFF